MGRILIADDNRDSAEILRMLLEILGYEVRTAHDGLEAVSTASTFLPGVACLDIGMPTIDGYEVAGRIREQPWGKQMILIAVTGWARDEDKQRALEAGFNYHMPKPIDVAELQKFLGAVQNPPGR